MRFPNLTTVIAFIRTMMGGATPTQAVGLAHQEPTPPAGNNNTASATKRQPAKTKRKAAPKAAQSTTQAKSRKPAPTTAKRKPTATGKQSATRASKTRQHAK